MALSLRGLATFDVAVSVLIGLGTVSLVSLAITSPRLVSFIPIQKPVFALDSRQEPYEGILHVRVCAGGWEQSQSLPRSPYRFYLRLLFASRGRGRITRAL
jgi:hypothetical protein